MLLKVNGSRLLVLDTDYLPQSPVLGRIKHTTAIENFDLTVKDQRIRTYYELRNAMQHHTRPLS